MLQPLRLYSTHNTSFHSRLGTPSSVLTAVRSNSNASQQATSYRLERAQPRDRWPILSLIMKEKINPLSLDMRNFMVARDEQGSVIACGQLKPLSSSATTLELSSIVVLPEKRCVMSQYASHLILFPPY